MLIIQDLKYIYMLLLAVESSATGQWFSPGPLVSSTNKTDCHDITEILLKVALNTIKPNPANHVNILKVLLKNHL
jgi:hypothetical protein